MTPYAISDRAIRRNLDPQPTPYFEPVTPTLHIGYRKGTTGSRWVLRRRVGSRYVTRTFREFIPDDQLRADNARVLSYQQVVARILRMNFESSENAGPRVCSFCKRSDQEVEAMVAGPDCFMCDRCVDIAHSIVAEHRQNPDRDWSDWTPPAPSG